METQHYFARITERVGDYEFDTSFLLIVGVGQTVDAVADHVLLNFRGRAEDPGDGGEVLADGGRIALSYHTYPEKPLPVEERAVLTRYLSVLGQPMAVESAQAQRTS